jgi:hypothetical protein
MSSKHVSSEKSWHGALGVEKSCSVALSPSHLFGVWLQWSVFIACFAAFIIETQSAVVAHPASVVMV